MESRRGLIWPARSDPRPHPTAAHSRSRGSLHPGWPISPRRPQCRGGGGRPGPSPGTRCSAARPFQICFCHIRTWRPANSSRRRPSWRVVPRACRQRGGGVMGQGPGPCVRYQTGLGAGQHKIRNSRGRENTSLGTSRFNFSKHATKHLARGNSCIADRCDKICTDIFLGKKRGECRCESVKIRLHTTSAIPHSVSSLPRVSPLPVTAATVKGTAARDNGLWRIDVVSEA